jgi:hypothetical protein
MCGLSRNLVCQSIVATQDPSIHLISLIGDLATALVAVDGVQNLGRVQIGVHQQFVSALQLHPVPQPLVHSRPLDDFALEAVACHRRVYSRESMYARMKVAATCGTMAFP